MKWWPSKNRLNKQFKREPRKWTRRHNNQNRPSADFSALIDRIAYEGRANRKEEKREEFWKSVRELLTIALLFVTAYLIYRQVDEMIKVYGPIRDQAEASKNLAKAASDQQTTAERSLVESQRAWVGPYSASIRGGGDDPSITDPPAIGKPVTAFIRYVNSGHEPALDFTDWIEMFVQPANTVPFLEIQAAIDKCRETTELAGGGVVYPKITTGLSASGYILWKTEPKLVMPRVMNGTSWIVVHGCLLYRTFNKPRHSYFCFYYRNDEKAKKQRIDDLSFCPWGQYAD